MKFKKERGEQVVAIIQAQIETPGLPGKIMAKINAETLLGHIINRVKRVKPIKRIAVVVTPDPKDQIIIAEAAKYGVPTIIGDPDDMLARFRTAARIMRAETIVRITPDSPMVSSEIMTRLVNMRKKYRYDYVKMEGLPTGTGAEVFTMRTLIVLDRLTTLKRHREHVTLYLRENPDDFYLKFAKAPVNLYRPQYLLAVNTMEDLQVLKSIYQEFPDTKIAYSLTQMVKFLDKYGETWNFHEEARKVAA